MTEVTVNKDGTITVFCGELRSNGIKYVLKDEDGKIDIIHDIPDFDPERYDAFDRAVGFGYRKAFDDMLKYIREHKLETFTYDDYKLFIKRIEFYLENYGEDS